MDANVQSLGTCLSYPSPLDKAEIAPVVTDIPRWCSSVLKHSR
jgi:hypothetical protein